MLGRSHGEGRAGWKCLSDPVCEVAESLPTLRHVCHLESGAGALGDEDQRKMRAKATIGLVVLGETSVWFAKAWEVDLLAERGWDASGGAGPFGRNTGLRGCQVVFCGGLLLPSGANRRGRVRSAHVLWRSRTQSNVGAGRHGQRARPLRNIRRKLRLPWVCLPR